MVDSAQDHINLADEITLHVVEVLKGVERKNEETKKKVRRLDSTILNAHCLSW